MNVFLKELYVGSAGGKDSNLFMYQLSFPPTERA